MANNFAELGRSPMIVGCSGNARAWNSQRHLRPSAIYRQGRKTRWLHRYGLNREIGMWRKKYMRATGPRHDPPDTGENLSPALPTGGRVLYSVCDEGGGGMRLSDSVAIVTGGARGIGAANVDGGNRMR